MSFNFAAHYANKTLDKGVLNVDTLAFYEGQHIDADGFGLTVTKNMIKSAVRNYEERLGVEGHGFMAIKKRFGVNPGKNYAPVSVDHEKNQVNAIVGRIMSVESHEIDGREYMFAKLAVPDENAAKKIMSDPPLYKDVSLSVDCDEHTEDMFINELSFVWDGALEDAMSFSKFVKKELPLEVVESEGSKIRRIEASKISSEINSAQKRMKTLEYSLQREYNRQEVRLGLEQLVRDGSISRADYKSLMIDTRSSSFGKSDVYLRSIRTLAFSKKKPRGRLSNDAQMTAMENFMNTIVENGAKMKEGIDPHQFAKNVLSEMRKAEVAEGLTKSSIRRDFNNYVDIPAVNHVPNKESMVNGENLLDTDTDETIKLRRDDMHRFASMINEGKHDDAMKFMSECSGMDFAKKEDEDSHDMAKGEDNKDKTDDKKEDKKDKKKSSDYAKFANEESETIHDFKKQIAECNQNVSLLMNKLVEMSQKQGDE